jgi:hypothetical protein
MSIKLITVCSHPEHAGVLIRSAEKNVWDLVVIEVNPWKGFGTKLIETYNYLKANPEVDRFVFVDAFDVLILGTPDEFETKLGILSDKFVCSAERGLWPPVLHPYRAKYFSHTHGFNYINSGCYYCPSDRFIGIMEKYPIPYDYDDQLWLNLAWLLLDKNHFEAPLFIDCSQQLFNSHSFISEGEYGYENGRVQILGNEPVFVHSNGRTVDTQLDELIKEIL